MLRSRSPVTKLYTLFYCCLWHLPLSFPACSPGRFGPFCTQTCSCPAGLMCDRFSGACVCESGEDDCKRGDEAKKLNDLFFPGCSVSSLKKREEEINLCLSSPPPSTDSSEQTGSVMVPLPPGEKESWGAISGIVVLVILVVLLLVLLLFYRRRQKDKQSNTPTVSFSTSRTVNSEYAVPGAVQRAPPPGHDDKHVLELRFTFTFYRFFSKCISFVLFVQFFYFIPCSILMYFNLLARLLFYIFYFM